MPRMMRSQIAVLSILITAGFVVGSAATQAQDWPQIHGPSRNGHYSGSDLAKDFSTKPKELFAFKIGEGYSGPVVATGSDGKTRVLMFHRPGAAEVLDSLDANSGKPDWQYKRASQYRDAYGFNSGPRGTPTVAGDRVYTYGAEGRLSCVNLLNGKLVWEVACQERFRVKKGFFGAAPSPLVHDGKVIVNVGGSDDSSIVAFDAKTGKVIWQAGDHEASYSSPIVAKIGSEEHLICFDRQGLMDLDPKDGRQRYELYFRARIAASVNAATPLVSGNKVFLSSSYRTGAVVLQLGKDKFTEIWKKDAVLSNHYATSVAVGDLLFGYDGRQEAGCNLRCIDFSTGAVHWSEDRFGSGTLIAAGDRVLTLIESGELVAFRASKSAFTKISSVSLFQAEVRAYPALAHGKIYARSQTHLRAFDLTAP